MSTKTIIGTVVAGYIGLYIIKTLVNGVIITTAYTAAGVSLVMDNVKNKKKIKKGLKNGSIVEIDGEYYEAKILDAEEA